MGSTTVPAGWEPLGGSAAAAPDPSLRASAFSRLARVHALSTGVDTLVATSLAGSLFFSIPTGEARGRVALYLLATIAPFAVVGPVLGPFFDRVRGGRRMLVLGTGVLRVLVCAVMSRHVDGLLLFPLAFCILVLGKSYAIARSALVPSVVGSDTELVDANARLSLISGVVGFVAAVPGAVILKLAGAEWVLVLAAAVAVAQSFAAAALPRTQVAPEPAGAAEQAELHGASVVLASEAMGLLRGTVGFLTFLLAFALRGGGDDTPVPTGLALGRVVREAAGFELAPASTAGGSAPTWHFGLVLGASVLSALFGALLAPRLRASMSEERILQGVLAGVAVAGLFGALLGGLLGSVVTAAGVGLGASAGKLAFDSIVQRDAPDANRGRSFASFETRFQLFWVIGGFLPVVVVLPDRIGFLVVAGAAAFALFTYVAGLRGLHLTRRRGPFGPPEAEVVLVGPPPESAPPPPPF